MKLTVKTLKGEMIHLQVDPEGTVKDIKEKVKEEKGIDIDSQKIIFKGKTTTNDDVIQAIGIKENDFLVLMTLIKKPEKKQEVPVPIPVKQQKPAEQANKPVTVPEVKAQQKKPEKSSNQTSPEFQAKVTELMSMGFEREKCVAALNAAFGDADRAVDYIFNGIPENPVGGEGQITDDKVQNLFRALMSNPAFTQIKQLIRNDPNTLQPILAQISQSSPQLYALISQHPEAFQRVIMEEGGQGGQGGQVAPPRPPPGTIQISPEQGAAISRLMSFGFSKLDAAQAYFACDKNEELAANLLFDRQANGDLQPMDQPQQPGQQGGDNNDDDDDNLFN